MEFSLAQVRALCGGQFPWANGFVWSEVDHFRLEGGVLQPYDGFDILPGPGLEISVTEVP